jgi:GT2 family glycosyltransferase
MIDTQDYVALYLSALPRAPRAVRRLAEPPVLADRHYLAPDAGDAAALPLETLFIAGVECAQAEARAELKRRAALSDVELAELRSLGTERRELAARLRSAEGRASGLETAFAATKARIDELESSTTWRATAPIRRAGHAVKLVAARLSASAMTLRQWPHYLGIARAVLRTEGPRALMRRVGQRLRRTRRYARARRTAYRQETEIRPLAFVESARPRVTIIVPMLGKALVTYTCLKSVHAHTTIGTYEVVVVDDGSTKPAASELAAVTGVRFLRNERNEGFVASCNKAAAIARGDVIVFLNNDTIVTPAWLDALTEVLERFPDAGLVGGKLIYPDGTLQEAGGIVWRDGSAWNFGRGDDADRPEYNYVREVDYCSGACLAIDRKLFGEIGGFDGRFAPAYYEDTDLAFAVRAAGRKAYYQPFAAVVHFEGSTAGTNLAAGVKQHQVSHQAVFQRKWEDALAHHLPNGVAPQLESDRWARRRVLVIDACMLTPDRDSGSLRMLEILRILVGMSCKVTFIADNLEHRQPYVHDMQRAGIEVQFHPYTRSVAEYLERHGKDVDLVIASRHYIASKHLAAVRTLAPKALVVFDTVDLHFLREERLAELTGDSATRVAAALRDDELALVRKADLTLVVSHVEQELLAKLVPEARVMILSNIHEPRSGGKTFAEREGLLFVGGFRHPPNTDAMVWYAAEILPLLRQRLPGVKTYVVGGDVPPTIEALASDDLVIAGHVPDVTPYLRGCRVAIAPLRYGAGVKGKLNLAMSYGLPVAATTVSIEAMHLEPGRDVLVGDSAEAFANAVVRAYSDADVWSALSEGGLANVRRHFSPEVAKAVLTRLLALSERNARDRMPALA